jgi:glutamine synthetase type III
MGKIVEIKYRGRKPKHPKPVPVAGRDDETFVIRDIRDKFLMMDNAFIDSHARKCGAYATSVYLSLCRHAGQDQGCFPSVRLIGEKMGISKRQVIRALEILEYYKIIKVSRFVGEHNAYVLMDKSCWKLPDDKRMSGLLTARWKRKVNNGSDQEM